MASAHIEISESATRFSRELRNFIRLLQSTVNESDRLKAVYDQVALGSDWTALGAALDIDPTDAETVYNLLGSVEGELDGAFIAQFLSRLG